VIIPMVSSPLIGFVGGLIVMDDALSAAAEMAACYVNRVFGKLQLCSSAYMGWSTA
jgi:hypothetical protein